jgi:phosphatidylinositol kinase/protein kinase (PI-3  family)
MRMILLRCPPPLNSIPIVTYDVVPTSANTGFIEMVEAETFASIFASTPSILEWIVKHNPQERAGIISNTFMASVAAWTVIEYLLGIGDRHLDNIMITRDGKMMNIDFGHILGSDPMYLATLARIPVDVVKDNQEDFMKWCRAAYLELRRYAVHFYTLL